MLREDLGDEIFFKGLRKYYADFQNSTALTKDFQNVMENVSGKELEQFFRQWLWQAGHPVLEISREQRINDILILKINQVQENICFRFPFDVEFEFQNGEKLVKTINILKEMNEFHFSFEQEVKALKPDPNVKLLFEEVQ
jgi:aminopeptidase N